MSVRQGLLAILDLGPCYGYQLRSEFDRRTGSALPLNVGQIYSTLERLERDGLVTKAGADDQGHVFYEITPAGSADVSEWLASPVIRSPSAARDELALKFALAATLPGAGLADAIVAQEVATTEALRQIAHQDADSTTPRDAHDIASTLLRDAHRFQLEAELRWLEHARASLERAPAQLRQGIPLDRRPAKRGRPSKA